MPGREIKRSRTHKNCTWRRERCERCSCHHVTNLSEHRGAWSLELVFVGKTERAERNFKAGGLCQPECDLQAYI